MSWARKPPLHISAEISGIVVFSSAASLVSSAYCTASKSMAASKTAAGKLGKSAVAPPSASIGQAVMREYYAQHFPFGELFAAFTRGSNGANGERREIAMWWGKKLSRWRSLGATAEAFSAAVQKTVPDRIEIGVVYDCPLGERELLGRNGLYPVERELAFDIDLDESFDGLRSCPCKGVVFCKRCWPLVTDSARLLDTMLRELYGYSKIVWVYSGRRGLHAWVFDDAARVLSPAGRVQIVERLASVSVHIGSGQCPRLVLPTCAAEFLDQVHGHFRAHLERNPDLFTADAARSECLVCTDSQHTARAIEMTINMHRAGGSAQGMIRSLFVWSKLCDLFWASQRHVLHAIAMRFCFPRLDAAVTEGITHLLKMPFCVHPGTGHVCIVLRAGDLQTFYPGDADSLPSVGVLCGSGGGDAAAAAIAAKRLLSASVAALVSEIS